MKSKAPLVMMEQLVMVLVFALAAAICAAPVLFGFVVTRWVKHWNRADRDGGVV